MSVEDERAGRSAHDPGFVSAMLLAAGLSTRFGTTKQLARFGGVSLVAKAVATLQASRVDEIVVVVGHRGREVAGEVGGTKARVVANGRYTSGMGSSIKTGLANLSSTSQAVVVCLADQPLISPRGLNLILVRWRATGADVVVSSSGDVESPPVLFSRRLYGELARIPDGAGARAVIESHPGRETVEFPSGALLDVDTRMDLERAEGSLTRARRGRAAGRPSRARPS